MSLASPASALPTLLFPHSDTTIETHMEGTTIMQFIATFVWMVMLVSAFQVTFLTWLLWPALHSIARRFRSLLRQKTHCAWCWDSWHIRRWFPGQWSSCLCQYHYRIEKKRLAARRTARLVARPAVATIPVAVVGVGQEPVHEQVEVLV